MNQLIYTFLRNIIKLQNEYIIKNIAKKYGLNEAELLQKYNTPSFYNPVHKDETYFNIIYVEKTRI